MRSDQQNCQATSSEKKPRIRFHTQGCRLNHAETDTLAGSFQEKGYEIVSEGAADVVVVNTCTVTENGDRDTRQLVNRITRENPGVEIALVGCQAQILKSELLTLSNVKWVVGNAEKMQLAQMITKTDQPMVVTPKLTKTPFKLPHRVGRSRHTRANIKIQDGCDFYCSFCIIPFARGPARSREFDDIQSEAAQLVRLGHKELVLTGINIGTYQDEGQTIVNVIDALNQLPGLSRIRISSIEPTTIPDDIFHRIANPSHNLCQYLHIPIQSGSDGVLDRMRRHYTVSEFATDIHKISAQNPDVCIGTDVMVGFPGETESEFDETYEVLKTLPIAYFHVFSYSERRLAHSRKFSDKQSPQTIKKRSQILRTLSNQNRRQFLSRFIGRTEPVLFEQQKQGWWTGLTEHYVRVVVQSDKNLKNQLIPVQLEGLRDDLKMSGRL